MKQGQGFLQQRARRGKVALLAQDLPQVEEPKANAPGIVQRPKHPGGRAGTRSPRAPQTIARGSPRGSVPRPRPGPRAGCRALAPGARAMRAEQRFRTARWCGTPTTPRPRARPVPDSVRRAGHGQLRTPRARSGAPARTGGAAPATGSGLCRRAPRPAPATCPPGRRAGPARPLV
jgi:hypothetical protein